MRIKLLLSIAVALFATSFSTLHAQTDGKKREVGIQFSGINFDGFTSFNALYRKQKSENVYRRIRATFGNVGLLSNDDQTRVTFNAGIAIGREKRKTLDRKLEFYRGPEFRFGLGLSASDTDDGQIDFNASFGYVLGLQHSFNDLWAINLETIPSVGASIGLGDDSINEYFSIGAGFSNAVSLGVVRKF